MTVKRERFYAKKLTLSSSSIYPPSRPPAQPERHTLFSLRCEQRNRVRAAKRGKKKQVASASTRSIAYSHGEGKNVGFSKIHVS